MNNQRSFSLEFKRQVVEELLSGESRPAQICRRFEAAKAPAEPTTKECPYCFSKISIKATRCPSCTSQLQTA